MNTNPRQADPVRATADACPPLPFRERWRQLKLAHCAVPNYGNSRKFWGSKKKIHTVYTKGDGKHDEKTAARLAAMKIMEGCRVLDIGAGPGTYAIPLAKIGCRVTVVEPSPVMRDLLATRIRKEKVKNIVVIPKRWEDVDLEELGEPFDAVIASFSLTMMDMGEALAKMNACCKGTVHLFWFLTEPTWAQVNRDLWPLLHGGTFPGEPTADWLWQILCEMGIYASIRPEPQVSQSRYANEGEAAEEFLQRLNCTTAAHEEILRNYLHNVLKRDGDSFVLGNGTRSAHIWWNATDQ
ncbi:class I SAM-dependent methyltransferase [Methanoregula sp.]|uniref:class I SAM-dependent methyltransferase n=1 Tax=Methanoregula sp. TaxID=2052170 RepID=UPI002604E3B5|nr:class I SAM-dependent methyltransferase [Methanoregula sp.]MDD5142795.1 class I SAM-dependent methyltransferase [Methanoregula sp.]